MWGMEVGDYASSSRIIHRFWAEVLSAAGRRRAEARENAIQSMTVQDARSLSEMVSKGGESRAGVAILDQQQKQQ